MLIVRKNTPTLFPYVLFTFGLIVEFVKEFGGVSQVIHGAMEVDTKEKNV
jgi:hypothetical protein